MTSVTTDCTNCDNVSPCELTYKFTEDDVKNTNYATWYPIFKKHCFPSIILPLPGDVVSYLKSPSLVLPEGTPFSSESGRPVTDEDDWDTSEIIDSRCDFMDKVGHLVQSQNDSESSDEDEAPEVQIKFTEFDVKITDAIKTLGGSAFPKLNGISPKDASWIALNRSLRCFLPGDIYLLLKSSDRIADILSGSWNTQRFTTIGKESHEGKFHLILRKWIDSWKPEWEFRCFVFENRLIAICQRDTTISYPDIEQNRDQIIFDIYEFFRTELWRKFPAEYYVYDILRYGKNRLKLLDFHVFGHSTDPLLFRYEELQAFANDDHPMQSQSDCENSKEIKETNSGGELVNAHIHGQPNFRYISSENRSIQPTLGSLMPQSINVIDYLPK